MKKDANRKTAVMGLLIIFFIGVFLSGCAAYEKNENEQTTEQKVILGNEQDSEPMEDETIIHESTETEPARKETTRKELARKEPDEKNEVQADSEDEQETELHPHSLYEQFINNEISATISGDYPKNYYGDLIFEKGNSYTLAELGECVSEYYFDSEYTDKTSYDYVQYAYVDCLDSANTDDKNLLIKFVGLGIYSPEDDSYGVFVITEDDGKLFVTDGYECWARSATIEYANGTLMSFGSFGAGAHASGWSVILSNGKQTTIYDVEFLTGWFTNYVGETIHGEVFGKNENAVSNFSVAVYTIGDEKYYLYYISECTEEEKVICEKFINRCREEQGIHWVTEEEIEIAIKKRCSAIGVDDSIIQQEEESAAVWNDL